MLFPEAHAIFSCVAEQCLYSLCCSGTGGPNLRTHRREVEHVLNEWLRELEERKEELIRSRPVAGWALVGH